MNFRSHFLVLFFCLWASNCFAERLLPGDRLYGVTLDSVGGINAIVDALKSLTRKPTTRIVFDELIPATDYQSATNRIHEVSYVMGELLDSYYVKQYSVAKYLARATEYLSALNPSVDIWEIGNEVNGEWLGTTSDVVKKISGAFEIAKANGQVTALTLYYNEKCWEKPANEMFTWAAKNVPEAMKQGLDYVLVSYYEDDCNGLQPNWQAVFNKLGTMFPNSKIGFGEVGTTKIAKKEAYIRRYYTMNIIHPRFIGGYFWWYGRQDFIPKTKALWPVFNEVIRY